MLQSNRVTNECPSSDDSKEDFTRRLEKLNEWQEEQKRLLAERQNMQRQLLGVEQQKVYEMLGLFHFGDEDDECDDDTANLELKTNPITNNMHNEIGDDDLYGNVVLEREAVVDIGVPRNEVLKVSTTGKSSGYSTEEIQEQLEPTKKTFLKRGEGLKQRFKIDPEKLRINNLPRYKFANSHSKFSSLHERRQKAKKDKLILSQPARKPTSQRAPQPGAAGDTERIKSSESAMPIDLQEKRFQHLLLSSKNFCQSTPETKSALFCSVVAQSSTFSTLCKELGKIPISQKASYIPRVSEQQRGGGGDSVDIPNNNFDLPEVPISWSKVLDSQQIKPVPVEQIHLKSHKMDATPAEDTGRLELEEENITIFELLEKKAAEGSFDMDSSCIRRFMQQKLIEKLKDNSRDLDELEIPVNNHLKDIGIRPTVDEVSELNESLNETNTTDKSNHKYNIDEEYVEEENIHNETSESKYHKQLISVEELDSTAQNNNDGREVSDSTTNSPNNGFQHFTNALLTILQRRNQEALQKTKHKSSSPKTTKNISTTKQSPQKEEVSKTSASIQASDLQNKMSLIKDRLAELENEISTFKENNSQLLKAKQEHEMERAQLTQEHLEAMEHLNDERIQVEIYLHDERMKMEKERQEFEEKMRSVRMNSKDRKEITRLKLEMEELQMQLKQKEHTHAASQARLRVQIRNLEKDQKALYESLEQVKKENKRLQMENDKINRERNSKMLDEINKNIAKLAPKMTHLDEISASSSICKGVAKKQHVDQSSLKSSARRAVKSITHKPSPSILSKTSRCSSSRTKATSPRQCQKRSHGLNSQKKKVEDMNTSGKNSISIDTGSENSDVHEDSFDEKLKIDQNLLQKSPRKDSCKSPCKTETTSIATKSDSVKVTETNETETKPKIFKREIINSDGSKDIWYPNGNLKKISADGMNIRMLYFNKDIKETNVNEGTVKYYYAATNTWHTTYLDGLEILEFPNGQVEHRHKNGVIEIHFPNNSIKIINPKDELKLDEWRLADGTNIVHMRNGDRILVLPNGQKEIHSKLNKRREYPDGTVKLVYPDGSQETRYSNGRVRLKDKDGKLIMDNDNPK